MGRKSEDANRIWGRSHWSNKKTNKTGETDSGNGKTANSGVGSTSKPVENPTKSKPSTTPKTNPEKKETPNEVNTWKPSPTKKKDKGKPQADTKPPKSSEPEKPEENPKTNKTKDNPEGTEGTGKDLLSPNGKFIDSKLESDYQKYLARKAKEGKPP